MQGQIHICFISVGNRVHLSFVSVDLRTRVARYPVQDKGGEAPLEEDGAQACIICGMLGCCIPGTFFPQALFSPKGSPFIREVLFKWNSAKQRFNPPTLKQTDALWELFSPKIGKFFKTAVLTLGNDILTMTMVKLCSWVGLGWG